MIATHVSMARLPFVRVLQRLPAAALLCAAGLLLGVILAATHALEQTDRMPSRPAPAEPPAPQSAPSAALRAREGTEIFDQWGTFRSVGDRITFFLADGRQRYVVLENLNLERIARSIADSPDPLRWSVSGTLTEYRGANYLLVTRVVAKGTER